METLAALGHGFAVALTPTTCSGPRSGSPSAPRSASCPASARRSPWRCCCRSPTTSTRPRPSSCSPASTTVRCTAARPPPSCSTRRASRLDRDRDRRPRDGAAGPRRPGAGHRRDRLVRRRHHRHVGLTFVAPLLVKLALLFGPAEYFALMVLALVTVTAVLGDSAAARARQPVLRPGAGPGRDRPADRAGAVHAGHPRDARRHRHGGGGGRPVRDRRDALRRRAPPLRDRGDLRHQGLDVDEPRGLGALVEAVAARHRVRLPDRRPAGRRQRDPDLPLLPDREEADPAPRGVRPRRDRGRGRTRGRQQRRRRRRAGAALVLGLPTSATAAIMLPPSSSTGCSRGPSCSRATPSWSGA